jgi:hypothetical protein
MVLVGLLVVRETVSQALGIPLGSVSVMMLAGWIVCGPQRHLGRLPGTWGHHRLPPLADTSWAALQTARPGAGADAAHRPSGGL